jgi:hypothetical protein
MPDERPGKAFRGDRAAAPSEADDVRAGFAPPPFKPTSAQLKRALRDLKLAERGAASNCKGKAVVELAVDGTRSPS